MADVVTTLARYDGQFKERYASKLSEALPSHSILQMDIPFDDRARLGKSFNQPVRVRHSQSFDYLASGDGVVTLVDVKASEIKNSNVKGSQIIGRDAIEYEALFSGNPGGGEQSFSPTVDLVVEGLWESTRFRIEADLLYGQDELGVVSGAPVGNVVQIATAEWAEGLWLLAEGAEIEVFDSAGTTKRTGIGAAGQYTIQSVDLENRTITVDDDQNIADTDRIFFRKQRTTSAYKTMQGIHSLTLSGGTLLGIDSSTYQIFKPNVVSAGNGPLLLDHILKAAAKISVKGGYGQFCAYVNPIAFSNSIADSAALRRYDQTSSINKYIAGAKEIEFHTGAGKVEVKSHPLVKEGYAYVLLKTDRGKSGKSKGGYGAWRRVGAQDLTFENLLAPGGGKKVGTYFLAMPDTNAVELRSFSHQALHCGALGRAAAIKDIVND